MAARHFFFAVEHSHDLGRKLKCVFGYGSHSIVELCVAGSEHIAVENVHALLNCDTRRLGHVVRQTSYSCSAFMLRWMFAFQ